MGCVAGDQNRRQLSLHDSRCGSTIERAGTVAEKHPQPRHAPDVDRPVGFEPPRPVSRARPDARRTLSRLIGARVRRKPRAAAATSRRVAARRRRCCSRWSRAACRASGILASGDAPAASWRSSLAVRSIVRILSRRCTWHKPSEFSSSSSTTVGARRDGLELLSSMTTKVSMKVTA